MKKKAIRKKWNFLDKFQKRTKRGVYPGAEGYKMGQEGEKKYMSYKQEVSNKKNTEYTENALNNAEDFSVRLTDAYTYDRLHILSAEYSVSVEYLVNVAVKRLVEEVDFVRKLRIAKKEET